jgi:hypothetical protein
MFTILSIGVADTKVKAHFFFRGYLQFFVGCSVFQGNFSRVIDKVGGVPFSPIHLYILAKGGPSDIIKMMKQK